MLSSLIIVSSGGGGGGSNNDRGVGLTPNSTRQWTLMVYLDGDNNPLTDPADTDGDGVVMIERQQDAIAVS